MSEGCTTMRDFLLFLHIAFAILLIGGLVYGSMMLPGLARGGPENVPALRKLHQMAKVFGPSSSIVFIIGLILAITDPGGFGYSPGQLWLSLSMPLFIVAAVIGSVPEARTTEAAIAKLERGESAEAEAKRLSLLSALNILILLVIVWLMVAKPGHTP